MTEHRQLRPRDGGPSTGLKGRHVLMMLIAFFGVIFSVNGVFLANALSTHTGVVSVEPYVKGLRYNERIRAGEAQARLGWEETLSLDTAGRLALSLRDAGGRPVEGLVFTGTVGRPVTGHLDRRVALRETAPGRYAVEVGALAAGTWVVSLEAKAAADAADPVWRMRRRQWLKP